jgi:NAD(P)-dependent dehydrogenase (short-subunit alcohol dehydrogenase family)
MGDALKDKVVLVTGGSTGIGRASALLFAREGAKVAVADVNVEEAEKTVRMIKEADGEAIFVKTDVSKAADAETMVNRTVEAFGGLHCAVNNAGVGEIEGRTHLYPEEKWDWIIDINLKGVWLCMKYELTRMMEQAGGAIVNVSSAAGLIGTVFHPVYSASKHGVVGLTKSVALQYAKNNIRVNAVCPGPIRTPMTQDVIEDQPKYERANITATPMARFADPREVAETIVWLCSDAASFVTGHAMAVDGGMVAQ